MFIKLNTILLKKDCVFIFLKKAPDNNGAIKKPKRYPNDILNIYPMPPPCENTGSPESPSIRYISTDIKLNLKSAIRIIVLTAKKVKEKGTGKTGNFIILSMHITAVNKDILMRFPSFNIYHLNSDEFLLILLF